MAADGHATNGHAVNGDDKATIVEGKAAGDKTFEVRAMTTGVWARDQDLEGAVEEQRAKASAHRLQTLMLYVAVKCTNGLGMRARRPHMVATSRRHVRAAA
jgi:hypothetical protein